MTNLKLHIEQDLIDELEQTPECVALFERVLGRSSSNCLLTDLSSLNDFCGSGMTLPDNVKPRSYNDFCDIWDGWVLDRIEAEFGIRLANTRLTLIQVIHQLQSRAAPVRH